MWPPLELIHLVHHLCIDLNKFLIVACGMACHSYCRAIVRPAYVIGGLTMFFILSLKTTHKFSIGLRSGDLADQSITSILAFCKNAVQTPTVCDLALSLVCFHDGLHMLLQNSISVKYSCEFSIDDNEISLIMSRHATPYHYGGPTIDLISFTYTSISQAFIWLLPHPLQHVIFAITVCHTDHHSVYKVE